MPELYTTESACRQQRTTASSTYERGAPKNSSNDMGGGLVLWLVIGPTDPKTPSKKYVNYRNE